MSEALHILLVDFDDEVALLEAAAPWAVHDLFHSLASPSRTVCYSKPKAHGPFDYVHSYELRLRGYRGCQRHRVVGVAMGSIGGDLSRAAGPRLLCAIHLPCFAAVARRGVVVLLPVHNDGLFVQNRHGRDQARVGVVGVEGQGVAPAQFEVHAGTDGDGLEDFHHLGMSVPQHTGVVHADYDVPCSRYGQTDQGNTFCALQKGEGWSLRADLQLPQVPLTGNSSISAQEKGAVTLGQAKTLWTHGIKALCT